MNITLHIEATDPRELREAISGLAGIVGAAVVTPQPESEKTKRNNRATTSPEKQPDPKPIVEPDAPKETPEETPDAGTDEVEEVIPTVVELRAKAQEKGTSAEGKKAIKALLDEFGSKSISDVPENVRAEFMRRLEAL